MTFLQVSFCSSPRSCRTRCRSSTKSSPHSEARFGISTPPMSLTSSSVARPTTPPRSSKSPRPTKSSSLLRSGCSCAETKRGWLRLVAIFWTFYAKQSHSTEIVILRIFKLWSFYLARFGWLGRKLFLSQNATNILELLKIRTMCLFYGPQIRQTSWFKLIGHWDASCAIFQLS